MLVLKDKRVGLLALACATALTVSETAQAQLDEIVVTAQKREQTLVDVPISVSAFSGEDLERRNIQNVADLIGISPSVSAFTALNASGFNPIIRGQGSAVNDRGVEQSVGTFVDGVYRSRPASIIADFIDIERVEILKGPQSSIFGRNNAAGAISILTKKPAYDFGAGFDLGYGRFDTKSFKSTVTGPLVSDIVAVRLSASFRDQEDGDIENTVGDDFGGGDRLSLRGQILIDVTNNTSLRLIGDWTDIDEDCCAQTALFVPTISGYTPAIIPNLATGSPLVVRGTPGTLVNPFDRITASDTGYNEKLEDFGVSAELNHDFGPLLFTAIGSFRSTDSEVLVDLDSTALPLSSTATDSEYQEGQVEIRLTSDRDDSRVDWLVGAFLYGLDITDRNLTFLPTTPGPIVSESSSETRSWALFGQAAVHLTDQVTTTLGLRFNSEERDASFSNTNPFSSAFPVIFGGTLPNPDSGTISDDEFMGDAAINYKVTEQSSLYARYGRGYKSPGFNLFPISSPDAQDLAFEAETANAYEVGAKLYLFDQLNLTVAGFYSQVKNQQITSGQTATVSPALLATLSALAGFPVTAPTLPTTTNAAEVETFGVELEFNWLATDALTLNGGVTYLNSEYDSYPNGPDFLFAPANPLTATQDLSGQQVLQSPKWAAAVGFQYVHLLSDRFQVIPRGDVNVRSSYFSNLANDPVAANDTTAVLNVSVEIADSQSGLSVQAWGKNVTDEEIIVNSLNGATLAPGGTLGTAYVNQPATWGVTVRGRF